jgi:phosphoribosylpyrophosphate synthetase
VQQVIGMVTHGVVDRSILEHLKASGVSHLVETDTRSVTQWQNFVTVLSVAELLANGIKTG